MHVQFHTYKLCTRFRKFGSNISHRYGNLTSGHQRRTNRFAFLASLCMAVRFDSQRELIVHSNQFLFYFIITVINNNVLFRLNI